MTGPRDPHRCDDGCVCPVHATPLLYWPVGDEHACQDADCIHAHGLVVEPAWIALATRVATHPR